MIDKLTISLVKDWTKLNNKNNSIISKHTGSLFRLELKDTVVRVYGLNANYISIDIVNNTIDSPIEMIYELYQCIIELYTYVFEKQIKLLIRKHYSSLDRYQSGSFIFVHSPIRVGSLWINSVDAFSTVPDLEMILKEDKIINNSSKKHKVLFEIWNSLISIKE